MEGTFEDDGVDEVKDGRELFEKYVTDLEEQTRHEKDSDAEAILKYLEERYGVSSYRYDWSDWSD